MSIINSNLQIPFRIPYHKDSAHLVYWQTGSTFAKSATSMVNFPYICHNLDRRHKQDRRQVVFDNPYSITLRCVWCVRFFVVGGWVGRWGGGVVGVVGWWEGDVSIPCTCWWWSWPPQVSHGFDDSILNLCYALKHFYKYIYKHTIFSCFWDINLRSIKT